MSADTVSMDWHEVGDGVLVRRLDLFAMNVVLVVGTEAALVVDTGASPRRGREIAAAVRHVTRAPLSVVNTHAHFDHCLGNSAFGAAPIWAHPRCAAVLRDRPGGVLAAALAEAPELAEELAAGLGQVVAAPSRVVADSRVVDLGGRRVELCHLGRGHTDHDIVVVVDSGSVVVAGDLVEEGGPPTFEDAFPLDWPATLDRLLDRVLGPVVPGHGRIVDHAYVAAQRAELAALADVARQALDTGAGADEAAAAAGERLAWPEQTLRLAVRRAAAQRPSLPRGDVGPTP